MTYAVHRPIRYIQILTTNNKQTTINIAQERNKHQNDSGGGSKAYVKLYPLEILRDTAVPRTNYASTWDGSKTKPNTVKHGRLASHKIQYTYSISRSKFSAP